MGDPAQGTLKAIVNLEPLSGATGSAIPPPKTFNPDEWQATAALAVARVLVFTFAGTIAATFLTIALIYCLSASPAQAKDFVTAFAGMIPIMENFVTKI